MVAERSTVGLDGEAITDAARQVTPREPGRHVRPAGDEDHALHWVSTVAGVEPMDRPHRTAFLLIAAGFLGGCAATISVPPAPAEPRPVFVVDHGRHSSLVLVRADHGLVRYAYGEWRWYAKQDTGLWRVFPTLFARTTAALGRRELAGPPTEENLRRRIPVVVEAIYALPADPARVDALSANLDGLFEARRDTLHYNAAYDLEFVVHPEPYTLGHNSNHVVAEWLRQLAVEVRGTPLAGNWRLAPSPASP